MVKYQPHTVVVITFHTNNNLNRYQGNRYIYQHLYHSYSTHITLGSTASDGLLRDTIVAIRAQNLPSRLLIYIRGGIPIKTEKIRKNPSSP